jgi:hypothetical protein
VALYALSYDEVDALADYARANSIGLNLLADPDSEVITRFGILNTEIASDDHPWFGIPYPGSYVIDADGTVTHKFFEQTLEFRASADDLLRAATGAEVELPPLTASPEAVSFDVFFDGPVMQGGVVRDLLVRFAVPEGKHLYGEPAPDAMVATSVTVDPQPGLVARAARFPPTVAHTLADSGETLQVFEGEVTIRIPITHLSRSLTTLDDGSVVQRVTGTVRWQACDDHTCELPASEPFSIDIPAAAHSSAESELKNPDGMDVIAHMTQLAARRTDVPLSELMKKTSG